MRRAVQQPLDGRDRVGPDGRRPRPSRARSVPDGRVAAQSLVRPEHGPRHGRKQASFI